MKNLLKKLKNRNQVQVISYYIILISYLLSLIYFIKNILALKGIENLLRTSIIVVFIIYFIIYLIWNLINIVKRKSKTYWLTSIITIIFIASFIFSSVSINYIYNRITGLTDNTKVMYTSYLISLKDTNFNDNSKIGMISDNNDQEGYVLANKIISNNNLNNTVNNYDDYLQMLNDLYDKKIDAIFVPSNYITLFNGEDKFNNIEDDTKVIYTLSEELNNTDAGIVSDKDFSEPLTMLVMGVDSESNGLNANAAFNGDTLMLITFNPKTLTATMFSIPRDTYVPIACRNNAKNKINSAAAYGTSCVIDTVQNFTGINIDYYVKINFKGVVELVDALGGVDVNVQEPDINTYKGQVCEQNSDREFGSSLVCMNPGDQTLNGEQALAYSRCRHLYLLSDLARIQHQQDVVTSISNKIVNISSLNEFEKVLNAVSNNIATNMSTNQILSGYKVIKSMYQNAMNGKQFMNINKTYMEVYNLNVYLESAGMYSSALGYYPDSLKAITKEMKVNLEIENPELIKTFSFSVNEPYEVKVIGKGITSGSTDTTLLSFANSTVGYTESWCNKHNVTCSFVDVDETSEYYNDAYDDGLVASQSVHAGELLSNIKSITFYVNKKSVESPTVTTNDNKTTSQTETSTTTTTDQKTNTETENNSTTQTETKFENPE